MEGEEDCEVLTTMGLIHQACVCTNLLLFYIKVYAVHASKLIRFANKLSMFHNYVPRYLQICNMFKQVILYWAYSTIFIYLVKKLYCCCLKGKFETNLKNNKQFDVELLQIKSESKTRTALTGYFTPLSAKVAKLRQDIIIH